MVTVLIAMMLGHGVSAAPANQAKADPFFLVRPAMSFEDVER